MSALVSDEAEWDDGAWEDEIETKNPKQKAMDIDHSEICGGCDARLLFWQSYPFAHVGAAEPLPMSASPHVSHVEMAVDKSLVNNRADAVPAEVLAKFYEHDMGKRKKATTDSKISVVMQFGGKNTAEDVAKCKRWTIPQCKPIIYDGTHIYTRDRNEIVGYYCRSADVRSELKALQLKSETLLKQLREWKDHVISREAIQSSLPGGLQLESTRPLYTYNVTGQLTDAYVHVPLARVMLRGTLEGKSETKSDRDAATCPVCLGKAEEWQDFPLLCITGVELFDLDKEPHGGGAPDRLPIADAPESVRKQLAEGAVATADPYVFTHDQEEKGWLLRSVDHRERLRAVMVAQSQTVASLQAWCTKKTVVPRQELETMTRGCVWVPMDKDRYFLVYTSGTQVPLARVNVLGQFKTK